jgi:hypothetical protein
MIYLFTTILFLLGVGYHVMQKIMELRAKFPELGFKVIFGTFFKQEWDSLLRSFLVYCTLELSLVIISMAQAKMPPWWDKYFAPYILALVLGYAGQRLAYKYLSTAEGVLAEKSDELKKL